MQQGPDETNLVKNITNRLYHLNKIENERVTHIIFTWRFNRFSLFVCVYVSVRGFCVNCMNVLRMYVLYVCMYVCMYVCNMYVCMCVYIYVCLYVCMYVHV